MLDILKNIRENFDDIKNNKNVINDNNLNTNNKNLNINSSTIKNEKTEPESIIKKLKDNTLFWIIIGAGILIFLVVIIILIRYLFYSSSPSQETAQQPMQQLEQQSIQQSIQQPIQQLEQQPIQQLVQQYVQQPDQQSLMQVPKQSIFSMPRENLQQYENYDSLKTINNKSRDFKDLEELKTSIKLENKDNNIRTYKSKSKSIFDNFNNDKDVTILNNTKKDITQVQDIQSKDIPEVQNIPSLPSKNSKSFVENATSSLATFFSFTPTKKEYESKDEEKIKDKEEEKKIGGSKRKYIKRKQSIKTNRKGKK